MFLEDNLVVEVKDNNSWKKIALIKESDFVKEGPDYYIKASSGIEEELINEGVKRNTPLKVYKRIIENGVERTPGFKIDAWDILQNGNLLVINPNRNLNKF